MVKMTALIDRRTDELGRNPLKLSPKFGDNLELSKLEKSWQDSLGRLVDGFSHEIRNPLNFATGASAVLGDHFQAIQGQVASLHKEQGNSRELADLESKLERVGAALSLLSAGTQRLEGLISRLEAFSEVSSFEASESTEIGAALKLVLELIQARLTGLNIEVELPDNQLPYVLCRKADFNQIVMNLLTNAIKAMPMGGVIRISVLCLCDDVEIRICDEGEGVPEHLAMKIFEPFFTTGGPEQGSGLGLAIAHSIASRSGGELLLDSNSASRGAEFVLRLPKARDSWS
jgi:signal transduction histidine kinase